MISCLIVIFISIKILKTILKNSESTYLNSFYVIYYIFQLCVSIVIVLLDPSFDFRNSLLLKDTLNSASLGFLLANIGILCGVIYTDSVLPTKKKSLLQGLFKFKNQYNIKRLSYILLLGFSFTIIGSFISAYIISALSLAFSFTPILIGFLWKDLKGKSRLIWIIALTGNFVFHMVQGSRGTALFPIVFLSIGYFISIISNKQLFKKRLIQFLIPSLLLLPLFSIVDVYRKTLGRGIEVSVESIVVMANFIINNGLPTSDDESSLRSSLGRFLNHPIFVSIYMTPDKVPYRGIDDMDKELAFMFQVSGEGDAQKYRENRDRLNYGTGVAVRYGFAVDEFTSVEWSVIADAYSRFGYLGIFIYSIVFSMFLAFLEKFCLNYQRRNNFVGVSFHLFILYNGMLSYMFSYYNFGKLVFTRGLFAFVVLVIISKMIKKKQKIRRQIPMTPITNVQIASTPNQSKV